MSAGRIVSSCCALLAIAAGAVVVVGMTQEDDTTRTSKVADARETPRPLTKTFADGATPRATVPARASSSPASPGPATTASSTPVARVVVRTSTPGPSAGPSAAPATSHVAARPAAPTRAATSTHAASSPKGTRLPLGYSAGNATHVLTVTAHSTGSTTATLQQWTKVSRGHWDKVGGGVTAHIGSQGMTTSPSESKSATPIGSFTLTQAFGYYANPGTALPYFRTTPRDYWMSSPGSTYNTHQRCPASNSGCHANGVNERLYYETPFYDYAVVIDYNTRNAPGGVRQGKGSAFFLHVTDGSSTAGCVAIPQSRLVSIMKWLTPSTHPRILVGTV